MTRLMDEGDSQALFFSKLINLTLSHSISADVLTSDVILDILVLHFVHPRVMLLL